MIKARENCNDKITGGYRGGSGGEGRPGKPRLRISIEILNRRYRGGVREGKGGRLFQ